MNQFVCPGCLKKVETPDLRFTCPRCRGAFAFTPWPTRCDMRLRAQGLGVRVDCEEHEVLVSTSRAGMALEHALIEVQLHLQGVTSILSPPSAARLF